MSLEIMTCSESVDGAFSRDGGVGTPSAGTLVSVSLPMVEFDGNVNIVNPLETV